MPQPHTGTEVSPTSLRHCGKVQDLLLLYPCGITVSFNSLYFQVHPTVSHVDQTVAERKKENYCMHLDNLDPLSQC